MTIDEAKDAVVFAALRWREHAADGAGALTRAVDRYRGMVAVQRDPIRIVRNWALDTWGDGWEAMDTCEASPSLLAEVLKDLEDERNAPR